MITGPAPVICIVRRAMEEVKFQSLSSKRLILRKPAVDDAREVFDLRSNEQVNQYLDRQVPTSIEDAVTFIEKILAVINKNQGCYWAICLKENPRLVGTICYFDFSSDQTAAEIGYELHPFYQHKGHYARSAHRSTSARVPGIAFEIHHRLSFRR